MKPSKPHSFLRIWVSVSGFAQPGTVLMALMEHIDVSAPASTAALTSPPRATSPAGRRCC
jgi:hypothetical protein